MVQPPAPHKTQRLREKEMVDSGGREGGRGGRGVTKLSTTTLHPHRSSITAEEKEREEVAPWV